MYKKLILFTSIALLFSCSKEELLTACVGDCEVYLEMPGRLDENGYYHVKLDWNRDYYPYFPVDIYASPTVPELRYNDVPVVMAQFDTDTYWVLGEEVTYKVNYYNPFESQWTSNNTILPTEVTDVVVNLFKGLKVFVVQNTFIYFSNTKSNETLYTRRIVGPFPPYMQGDTIQIDGRIFWEAGNFSELKKISSKFIIE